MVDMASDSNFKIKFCTDYLHHFSDIQKWMIRINICKTCVFSRLFLYITKPELEFIYYKLTNMLEISIG